MARHRSIQSLDTPLDGTVTGGPALESHQLTTVKNFLQSLYNHDHFKAICKKRTICDRLNHCYINFSHFTEDLCDPLAHNSLSREGLFGAFLRGRAIQCKQGQAGIDLVIPMAVLNGMRPESVSVSSHHMSAIIIQVKNRKTDAFSFTATNIHKMQFDLRHFDGLGTQLYVAIWMSFRSHNNDLNVLQLSTSTYPRQIQN